MLLRRVPKWVKNYPYDIDRAALIKLAKSSRGKLEKPREMNFVLVDFIQASDVESAIHQIEKNGWHCTRYEMSDTDGKFVIEAQKNGYILNAGNYNSDQAYFHRIADLYGAKYDGWYASS